MKLKASERQSLLQKVVLALRKRYAKKIPDDNRPLLETLLFAACLEDATLEQATAAHDSLRAAFHDLNEIRVSSITEIEKSLGGIPGAEWRALRIRDALQTVFEANYQFELDHLKRKTAEQALKELNTLRYASPYMKLSVLLSLGTHVVPLDRASQDVLTWLGLLDASLPAEAACEDLKSSVRKSDTAVLCHLLREFGADPAHAGLFKLSSKERDAGIDPQLAVKRVEEVLSGVARRKKTAAAKAESRAPAKAVKTTKKKPAAVAAAKRERPAAAAAKTVKKKVTKKPARSVKGKR